MKGEKASTMISKKELERAKKEAKNGKHSANDKRARK